MAGPTVGILVPKKLDDETKKNILEYFHRVANDIRGKDFGINGCPFIYDLGPEYPEELDEYTNITEALGWQPQDIVGLYAMCNGKEDHIELGKLTLAITKIVNGKVAFCDLLSRFTDDPTILKSEDTFEFDGESIIGVKLFEEWLKHPDFYMVK